MNIVLKPSGGSNIVLRPQARPAWYPPSTVDPVEVEIFRRELDADGKYIGIPVSLGRFPATGRIALLNNPAMDRNVRLIAVAYSADGTPDVSSINDAVSVTVLVQRETEAPQVGQIGASTPDKITIGISGFTKFATKRRIRIADNPQMDSAITLISDRGGKEFLPEEADILRQTPFLPSDLAGLALWLAADQITGLGDGAAVAQWSDASGLANHATQGTAAMRPLFKTNILNGKPVVRFDGVDDFLTHPVNAPGAFTAFVVARRTTGGSADYQVALNAIAPGNTFGATLALKASGSQNWGHYINSWKASSYSCLDTWRIMAVVASAGGADTQATDGTTEAQSDASRYPGDAYDRRSIGSDSSFNTGYLAGDLAEIILYNSALSVADRQKVEAYLSGKYGITVAGGTGSGLAASIYVRVAHSSGGAWGAESEAQEFTFADAGGTGGTSGDFDPIPRDKFDLDTITVE